MPVTTLPASAKLQVKQLGEAEEQLQLAVQSANVAQASGAALERRVEALVGEAQTAERQMRELRATLDERGQVGACFYVGGCGREVCFLPGRWLRFVACRFYLTGVGGGSLCEVHRVKTCRRIVYSLPESVLQFAAGWVLPTGWRMRVQSQQGSGRWAEDALADLLRQALLLPCRRLR
jgi:hypothetical protein